MHARRGIISILASGCDSFLLRVTESGIDRDFGRTSSDRCRIVVLDTGDRKEIGHALHRRGLLTAGHRMLSYTIQDTIMDHHRAVLTRLEGPDRNSMDLPVDHHQAR